MGLLSLIVRIGADGRQFRAGLREASQEASRWSNQLRSQIAGAFSAAAFIGFFRSIEQTASRIKDLSNQFDISTDDVQRFDHALRKDGLSAEDLGQALIRLGQARRKAVEGDEDATRIFARYGISLEDVNDNSLKNIDILKRMKQAMDSGNVSTKDRIELFEILGRSAEKLIASLRAQQGNEGVFFRKADAEAIDEISEKADALFQRFKGTYARTFLDIFKNPLSGVGPFGAIQFWKNLFSKDVAEPQKPGGGKLFGQLSSFFGEGGGTGLAEDKKLIQDIANLQERIEKAQMKGLSHTEQRARLEREITKHLENAEIIGNRDPEARRIQVTELSRAAELATALQGLGLTQPRSLDLTSLERVGGRAGPGNVTVVPEVRQSNIHLQRIEQNTKALEQSLKSGNTIIIPN